MKNELFSRIENQITSKELLAEYDKLIQKSMIKSEKALKEKEEEFVLFGSG